MKFKIKLRQGLSCKQLRAKAHHYRQAYDGNGRGLAFYLLEICEQELYKAYSFKSMAAFVETELELSARRASELMRVERALRDLPRIARACNGGKLGWCKARELTRIVTPENEEEWLTFALKHTVRELERKIRQEKERKENGPRPATVVLRQRLLEHIHTLFENARMKVRETLDTDATPNDEFSAMAELLEEALAARAKKEGRGSRTRTGLLVLVDKETADAWIWGKDGRVPVPLALAVEAAKHGKVSFVRKIQDPGDMKTIGFRERGSVPQEERDLPFTAKQIADIIARDGGCVICGGRHKLNVHHLVAHAHGGKSLAQFACTVCEGCHSLHHSDLLFLRYTTEGKLIAVTKEGKPLAREGGAAEVLEELAEELPAAFMDECAPTVIEEDERPAAAPPPPRFTLDKVPAQVTAEQWRSFEQHVRWDARRGAYVLRSGGDQEGFPRGNFPAVEMGKDKDLEQQTVPKKLVPRTVPRPRSLDDIIGQPHTVERLQFAASAARERGEPLGHLLLSGPAGVGKTTIAEALAAEMKTALQSALAQNMDSPHTLFNVLNRLNPGDILFIDELHGLSKTCAESLYRALEDGFVDVLVEDGPTGIRPLRMKLQPFTLVGATTELGALPEPFRQRFKLQEELGLHSEGELAQIVEAAGAHLGLELVDGAAGEIARRSRGTPREALRLLERARDVAQKLWLAEIGPEHVRRAADMLSIDEHGLSAMERTILTTLMRSERPLGLRTLATRLRLEARTLRDVYEPFLIERGFLSPTSLGRVATRRAFEALDKAYCRS